MPFCRHCGNKYEEGDQFCTGCGADLTGNVKANPGSKDSEKNLFWLVPLLLFLLALAASVWFLGPGGESLNPWVRGAFRDSLLLVGLAAPVLLILALIIPKPSKVSVRLFLAELALLGVFLGLFLPQTGRITMAEAGELVETRVKELTAKGSDYADLFSKGEVVEELREAPGGGPFETTRKLETPITAPDGKPAKLQQWGQVSVHPHSGEVQVGVSETVVTPESERVFKSFGAPGTDTPGETLPFPTPAAASQPTGSKLLFPLPDVRQPTTVLVVTNYERLKRKHPSSFYHLKTWLEKLGEVYDTSQDGDNTKAIQSSIREQLKNGKMSVFLFGGFDVVPRVKRANPMHDGDVIWGDDFYGDIDSDNLWLPDVDLGRIPDAPSIITNPDSSLYAVNAASGPLRTEKLVSVANYERPTAADLVAVANPVAEGRNYFKSRPYDHRSLPTNFYRDANLYLILHGSAHNGWGLSGEAPTQPWPTAFTVDEVQPTEVVFCGACYGAITQGRTASDSIAIAFLAKGTRAFMAHTGSSYSENRWLDGGEAFFWKLFLLECRKGVSTATAFRKAKAEYAGRTFQSSEKKNLVQLVYYGLPDIYMPAQKVEPAKPATPRPLVGYPDADRQPTGLATAVRRVQKRVFKPATPPAPVPQVKGLPVTLQDHFSGPAIDSGTWQVSQSGFSLSQGQLHLSPPGTRGIIPVLQAPLSSPAGDWILTFRLSGFKLPSSGGRYQVLFQLGGLVIGFELKDSGLEVVFGPLESPRAVKQPATTRSTTVSVEKRGQSLIGKVDGIKVGETSISGTTGSDRLTLLHGGPQAEQARASLDYVILQASEGDAPPPPEVKKAYFNDGHWHDLTEVFAASNSTYCYTDNKYSGTGELLFWAAYNQPQQFSIEEYQEEELDQAANRGEQATVKAEPISVGQLQSLLDKDGVPGNLRSGLAGKHLYRITVTAPDGGNYASYLLSSTSAASYAIGQSHLDTTEEPRARIRSHHGSSTAAPPPPAEPTLVGRWTETRSSQAAEGSFTYYFEFEAGETRPKFRWLPGTSGEVSGHFEHDESSLTLHITEPEHEQGDVVFDYTIQGNTLRLRRSGSTRDAFVLTRER